jgi:hypothetical protein
MPKRIEKAKIALINSALEIEMVVQISKLGLVDALQKYHNKPLEMEAKSIVAGPSFFNT